MEKIESFSIEDNNIINEENKDLKNRFHINNSNLNEPLIYTNNKKKKFPIIIFVFIFALLILIAFILTIIIEYIKKDKNYKTENEPFIKPSISKHNYTNLKFDNGLELLLIKVEENDKAGGAIIFDTGYLDINYEPGFLKLAFISLIDDDIQNPEKLEDYLGKCTYSIEEHYSYFSFNILNAGFFPYLEIFSRLTYLNENDKRYNEITNKLEKLNINYNDLKKKENHLLQYLIYGYSNKNKDDICPECNNFEINEETKEIKEKEKIKEIMKSLLNPSKMKIVLNSHYKMSLMKKKFLKYFNNIVNTNYKAKEEKPKYNLNLFSPNKMIYMNIKNYEINFIKINYFIDPKENDYETFTINSGYFNYIQYILDENNPQSLYYILTHSDNFNIYSLSCEFEAVLKSKIKFSIIIKLNYYSYANLQQIILIVYEYMNKLIEYVESLKEENEFKKERRFELYKIMTKSFNFAEDLYDITPDNYKKGINLFCKKDRRYFLRDKWFPEVFNISKLKDYTSQFTPNNSVLILAINNITNDTFNKYFENSTLSQLFKNTSFNDKYNIIYKIEELDILFENNLTLLKNDIYISNYENPYISIYNDSNELEYNPDDKYNYLNLTSDEISNNSLRVFYFKRDTSFHIPKVYMTLYFYHPFMRPQKEKAFNNQRFFELMLYMAYLKREIYYNLADALRAGNTIVMNFNQNLIYISIFAYSDKIYNISEIIKNIAMNNTMFLYNSEFFRKFEIYRDIALQDLLNFETLDSNIKIRMSFYEHLFNKTLNERGVYNIYNFSRNEYLNKNLSEMEDIYVYMNYINSFIMKGHIFGYLTFKEAEAIYDLFNEYIEEDSFEHLLNLLGIEDLNIGAENFSNWMNSKNNLKSNKSESIICPKKDPKIEKYRFIHWSKFDLKNKIMSSIFNNLLNDAIKNNNSDILVDSLVFSQGEIYLQLAIMKDKNEFPEYITNIIMENKKKYNKKVDFVGNRLYYIIRNNIMDLNAKHENMESSSILRLDSNTQNAISYKSIEKMKNKDYEEFPKDFWDIYKKEFHIDLNCIY